MKFGVIINEAYTPEMKKVLDPYLTDIGNALAGKNVSVQNLTFVDVGLRKPVVFNSVFRYLNDAVSDTGWYRNYQVALGSNKPGNSLLSYVICIFKHVEGGVSVCVADISRYDVKKPEDTRILTFGNAEGKIAVAFIAGLTENERHSLLMLRRQRSDFNKPAQDPHNVSVQIRRKLSYMDNPNLKTITERANKIGIKDFKPFVSTRDGGYILYGSVNTNLNLPGSTFGGIFSIQPNDKERWVDHKGTDKVMFGLEINLRRVEDNFSDAKDIKELTDRLKVLDDFKTACIQIRSFVDYLNSFTYEDMVWNR